MCHREAVRMNPRSKVQVLPPGSPFAVGCGRGLAYVLRAQKYPTLSLKYSQRQSRVQAEYLKMYRRMRSKSSHRHLSNSQLFVESDVFCVLLESESAILRRTFYMLDINILDLSSHFSGQARMLTGYYGHRRRCPGASWSSPMNYSVQLQVATMVLGTFG